MVPPPVRFPVADVPGEARTGRTREGSPGAVRFVACGRVLLPGGVGASAACAEGPEPGRDAGDLWLPGRAR